MRTAARFVSLLALGGTIAPALLFASETLSLDALKAWMLAAAVAWFASAPIWIDRAE